MQKIGNETNSNYYINNNNINKNKINFFESPNSIDYYSHLTTKSNLITNHNNNFIKNLNKNIQSPLATFYSEKIPPKIRTKSIKTKKNNKNFDVNNKYEIRTFQEKNHHLNFPKKGTIINLNNLYENNMTENNEKSNKRSSSINFNNFNIHNKNNNIYFDHTNQNKKNENNFFSDDFNNKIHSKQNSHNVKITINNDLFNDFDLDKDLNHDEFIINHNNKIDDDLNFNVDGNFNNVLTDSNNEINKNIKNKRKFHSCLNNNNYFRKENNIYLFNDKINKNLTKQKKEKENKRISNKILLRNINLVTKMKLTSLLINKNFNFN